MAVAAMTGAAHAQQAQLITVSVQSQDLGNALNQLARQTNVQIVFRPELVRGKQAATLSGNLTPQQALDRMLTGTDLTYRTTGPNAYVILAQATTGPQPQSGADTSAPQAEEEIVVTAQKREERLQDVPMSVAVLGGQYLDQSTTQGITEELMRVPGVAAFNHTQAGGTVVTVRGVAAAGPVFAGSSPVSYYLDSVPFGLVQTAIAPDANAYDLERVEVLRGPQGTIYGANAESGVVRVLTHAADLTSFDLKGRVSTSGTEGGDESYRADVAINVPLIQDRLAARAVLGYQDLGGWVDYINHPNANDAQIRNGRLRLDAQPTSDLTLSGSAWASRSDFGGKAASSDDGIRHTSGDESYSIDFDVYSFRVGYDFHNFTLTSASSYIDYSSSGDTDVTALFGVASTLNDNFNANVFSQEVYLNSEGDGPWRWTVGAMYRDGEDINLQRVPEFGLVFDWTNTSKSYAAFGELTRLLLDDTLELTVGGRYFHDDVESREDHAVAPVNPPNYYDAQDSFHAFTPRLVLAWHPVPNTTIYGSYSEGFRSGSPQSYPTTGGVPGFPSADPDKLHNYELGAKGDLGWISFDTSVYYIQWDDVQQQVSVLFNGAPVSAIINAQSASGLGVDAGVTFHPTHNLNFGGTVSWNGLTVDEDVPFSGGILFRSGERLNFSPEYTASAFADYSWALGGGFNARLSSSASYTSGQDFRSIVGGATVIGAGDKIFIGRASLSIEAPTAWNLNLFVDNITNEDGGVIRNPFFGPDATTRVRPRTFGIQVDYHY
ncbi:hypothetical protein U91I_00995 [alpha proteobacterium U9-1i]|nr:hypothetical protein U91I_00995 [alpha proteobacterium U9-1i]